MQQEGLPSKHQAEYWVRPDEGEKEQSSSVLQSAGPYDEDRQRSFDSYYVSKQIK